MSEERSFPFFFSTVLHVAALPTAWAAWWCQLRRLRSLDRW